ncbi:hypothetical protein ACLOJK_028773 [Asimina triloba]
MQPDCIGTSGAVGDPTVHSNRERASRLFPKCDAAPIPNPAQILQKLTKKISEQRLIPPLNSIFLSLVISSLSTQPMPLPIPRRPITARPNPAEAHPNPAEAHPNFGTAAQPHLPLPHRPIRLNTARPRCIIPSLSTQLIAVPLKPFCRRHSFPLVVPSLPH